MSRYTSLSDLLDELSPALPASGPGWDDVLLRADALAAASNGSAGHVPPVGLQGAATRLRRRRSRLTIALALVALAGVVVAAAYALGHPIIDFGKAPKSSRTVVNFFGRMTVMATPTNVLPQQARSITVVRVDGVGHRLSIAPVKTGGFCYEWSDVIGTCQTSTPPPAGAGGLNWTPGTGGLLWGGTTGKNRTLSIIGGSFLARSATQLALKYKDGTSDQIPFFWVTAPINAGFFLFGIPPAHQTRSDQPTSITLLDSANHPIETQKMFSQVGISTRPRLHLTRRHVGGYTTLSVPAQAEWPQRRQLLRLTLGKIRTALWVAPERGGGGCFATYGIARCSTPIQPLYPPVSGTMWLRVRRVSHYVVLCCTVARDVRRVVAHFQDGHRTVLKVTDGFVLWPIPKRHYAPGHRLDELLGYDSSGAEVGVLPLSSDIRELYPCSKPKDYGYGLVMCP